MLFTNIMDVALMSKRERTRARLEQAALTLFERQGFEQTTVAQIAEAAGVTPMTFFRHYTAKSRVLLDDPYDPVIAAAVAAQPSALDPLTRVARAIGTAWAQLPAPDEVVVRRKVAIVAQTPSIAGEMVGNNAATEALIVQALVDDGVESLAARAAAAATLAAITVAMLEWAVREDLSMAEALLAVLQMLERRDG
jgi:AcrR family transcriptional regulator